MHEYVYVFGPSSKMLQNKQFQHSSLPGAASPHPSSARHSQAASTHFARLAGASSRILERDESGQQPPLMPSSQKPSHALCTNA